MVLHFYSVNNGLLAIHAIEAISGKVWKKVIICIKKYQLCQAKKFAQKHCILFAEIN